MSDGAGLTPWFHPLRSSPRPALRLYCFPHAGGGPPAFRGWPRGLPEAIDVSVLQLPGRGARLREAPVRRLTWLADVLAEVLSLESGPFAFFGHSLGGLVAYVLTRRLRRDGRPGPRVLVVAACRAPHLPDPEEPLHALPEPAFRKALGRLHGTPPDVLANDELMQLLLPALRADFELIETYQYGPEPPLDCPVVAMGGLGDRQVSADELQAWKVHAGQGFSVHMFPGDHFFLQSTESTVLAALGQELRQGGPL